jgi:hypothetical protein
MSGRDTTRVMRALLACLQPLVGTRSQGTALIRSLAGDLTLPANTFGAPLIVSAAGTKQVDWQRLIRTTEDAVLTPIGTSVAVTSVLGGLDMNLAAGTEIRWDPPLENVELVSTLSTAMTGGIPASGPGSIAQVTTYEGVGATKVALDLFLARAGRFPAAVLSWDKTDSPAKIRRTQEGVRDLWTVTVITSRSDASEQRGGEWLYIKDAIEGELLGRSTVDGYVFSAPDVDALGAQRLATTETSYVYAMAFGTWGEVALTDRRVYYDWLRTRLDGYVDADPDKLLVEDLEFVQTPDFNDDFDTSFARVP